MQAIPEREILDRFYYIDSIGDEIDYLNEQIAHVEEVKALLDAKLEGVDSTTGDDGFVVIKEIFEGRNADVKKALPSVKLMGNGDKAIHLSTDTAPSRVFSYGMLRRLVEPAVSPNAKGSAINGRKTLKYNPLTCFVRTSS